MYVLLLLLYSMNGSMDGTNLDYFFRQAEDHPTFHKILSFMLSYKCILYFEMYILCRVLET